MKYFKYFHFQGGRVVPAACLSPRVCSRALPGGADSSSLPGAAAVGAAGIVPWAPWHSLAAGSSGYASPRTGASEEGKFNISAPSSLCQGCSRLQLALRFMVCKPGLCDTRWTGNFFPIKRKKKWNFTQRKLGFDSSFQTWIFDEFLSKFSWWALSNFSF